jgi:polar amino acid transport system substrate-binding protein
MPRLPVPAALLAGLLLAGAAGAAERATLRIAVNEANGRPYALYDARGRFAGGLAHDLIEPMANALGLRAEYLDLPRARVEPWLRAGAIDGACFLAPEWVVDAGALRWSPALFHIHQVIVSPPGAAPVATPRALFGRRLGTLLNYTYPELQPYFADGRIRRADGPSFEANTAKLSRGRIDAFLNDDIASLYAVRAGRLPRAARIDPLWAPPNPVYCAFSPAFAAREPRWHALLQAEVDDGRIAGWIARYTGRRPVAPAPAATPSMRSAP